MKSSILLFILILIFSQDCFSQATSGKVFSFDLPGEIPNSINGFKLFYIIDSSIFFKSNGRKFFKFTFSEDSTDCTGFISYDSAQKNILFISNESVKNKRKIIQKIFEFKNVGKISVHNFGFLGSGFQLDRRSSNNKTFFTPIYKFPKDSHSIYIKSIEFYGGVIPLCISFRVPFGENKIISVPGQAF